MLHCCCNRRQLSGHNSLVIPCAGPANEGWAAFRDCLARVCAVENVSWRLFSQQPSAVACASMSMRSVSLAVRHFCLVNDGMVDV